MAKSTKTRSIKIDLTGVESYKRASEGDHIAKLKKIVQKTSEAGNQMLVATFEVTKGADKGATVFENYPLMDSVRWKLKSLLEALGMPSSGKLKIDLDAMEGRALIISVVHEEYQGSAKARIAEVSKIVKDDNDDDDDDDDDDEDDYEDEDEE